MNATTMASLRSDWRNVTPGDLRRLSPEARAALERELVRAILYANHSGTQNAAVVQFIALYGPVIASVCWGYGRDIERSTARHLPIAALGTFPQLIKSMVSFVLSGVDGRATRRATPIEAWLRSAQSTDRPTSLQAYIRVCVKNELLQLKQAGAHSRAGAVGRAEPDRDFEILHGLIDYDERAAEETNGSDASGSERGLHLRIVVEQWRHILRQRYSQRDLTILDAALMSGALHKDIAERFGLTPARISQIVAEAEGILRELLEMPRPRRDEDQ